MDYRRKMYIRLRISTILLFSLFLPACFSANALAEELCVQLKWHHQSQFAGFYLAREGGYYREEGLDVEFLEGGPGVDWQNTIAKGPCPIGVTNPYEIVIARVSGLPVKAVAAVAQVSPIVWFSLKERGIWDPRQFKGKRVVLVPTGKIHLMGMLKKVGVPMDELKIMPFSLDLSRLYDGDADLWSGYHTNLVTKAEREGHKVNVIHPINYGVQIYDDVIYARDRLLKKSPDTLLRFLRATLRGWAEAIRDPELAVRHTLKYSGPDNGVHQKNLLMRTIPYVHTGEVPIGWMESSVWKEICRLTVEVGLSNTCPETGSVFTDSFLKDIYEEGIR